MANIKQKSILNPSKDFRTTLYEHLKKHKKVKLVGVGVFELKKLKTRQHFSPTTLKMITIKERVRIKFRPSKKFENNVIN